MFTINVTEEDIAQGKTGDSYNCPIALACKRIEGVDEVSIDIGESILHYKGKWFSYSIPDEATKFIHTFDIGDKVLPFTFTITDEGRELTEGGHLE